MGLIKNKWERRTRDAILAVIMLWLAVGFFPMVASGNWATRGQMGDMFGAVNALFSGLAFAGLILAIGLQRQELALQREELKMTREELKRTAEAQEESSLALRQQVDILLLTAKLTALNQQIERARQIVDDLEKNPDLAFQRVYAQRVQDIFAHQQTAVLRELGVQVPEAFGG